MKLKSAVVGLCLLACASQASAGIVKNGGFNSNKNFDDWSQHGPATIDTSLPRVDPMPAPPLPSDPSSLLNNGVNDAQALINNAGDGGNLTVEALEASLGLPSMYLSVINNVENGRAISQEITGSAGEILSFDWIFLTSETDQRPTIYNDFAFVLLYPGTIDTGFDALEPDHLFAMLMSINMLPSGNVMVGPIHSATISLPASSTGSYVLAFGVVNVEDVGGDSRLAIDNVQLIPASTPIPEPGTVLLLGSGLLGLALWRRRRTHQ